MAVVGAPNAGQAKSEVTKQPQDRQPAAPTPESPKAPVNRPGGLPDIKAMSKEDIVKLLEQRRSELATVQQVAKEKGIKTEAKAKTAADKDRLMEFWNRVGYQTGMARWATGRRAEVLVRLKPIVEALGESWDTEKRGEAVDAMVEGFREARIQTSFKSTSMPEKKTADAVAGSEVLKELVPLLQGLGALVDGLLEGEL